jgi:hypothetical protein
MGNMSIWQIIRMKLAAFPMHRVPQPADLMVVAQTGPAELGVAFDTFINTSSANLH